MLLCFFWMIGFPLIFYFRRRCSTLITHIWHKSCVNSAEAIRFIFKLISDLFFLIFAFSFVCIVFVSCQWRFSKVSWRLMEVHEFVTYANVVILRHPNIAKSSQLLSWFASSSSASDFSFSFLKFYHFSNFLTGHFSIFFLGSFQTCLQFKFPVSWEPSQSHRPFICIECFVHFHFEGW